MNRLPPEQVASTDQAFSKIRDALNRIVQNWHTDRATLTKALIEAGEEAEEARLTAMLQVALVAGGYTQDPIFSAALLACAVWKLEVQKDWPDD